MPRGDRTGPAGTGPMTGRGLGYCAGYSTPGFTKGVPRGGGGYRGFGYGRGFGRGRGYRAWGYGPPAYGAGARPYYGEGGYYGAPASEEEELEILREEAEALKKQLEEINKRVEEIESNE